MISSKKDSKKTDVNRDLRRSVVKLSTEEVNTFLVVFAALMQQTPCPKEARKSYLSETKKRLRANGVGFISSARAFPTLGLKLLGKDYTGFPVKGFKKQSGQMYPSYLAWYWQELKILSLVKKPTKNHAKYARKLLTVLSFARMIRMSSLNHLKSAMKNFMYRMENPSKDPDDAPCTFDPAVMLDVSEDNFVCSSGPIDYTCISTKPSSLVNKIQLPSSLPDDLCFAKDTEGFLDLFMATYYSGPYGNVKILTENGGKTRVIVPYNSPFVHSVSLYRHVRKLLSSLKEDVSLDQSIGHRACKQWSREGKSIVSADLTAMTDLLSPKLQIHFLRSMNLAKLVRYLYNLTVIAPNGKRITPKVLLMGFKGNFELGSLIHHWYVKSRGITSYVMCGDDLAYQGNLDTYESELEILGPPLNRSKTVTSKTVAVFCGEYYWMGHTVTPCAPKLHSFFSNHTKKVASATIVFSSLRNIVKSLSMTYRASAVWRITRILRSLLRRRWVSYIPWCLPSKLRGMGYQNRTGSLLALLEVKACRKTACLSVGVEKIQVERQRWFGFPIQIDQLPQPVGCFLPSLLFGGVSFDIVKPGKARRKDVSKLDLADVLCWYYDNQRVPLEMVLNVSCHNC
jgi:hypothetical protein